MLCSMLGVSQRVFQNTICSPWGNMSPFGMCSIFYNLSSILVTESDDTLDIYSKISSVQSLSCVWLFVTPWTAERLASLSITNSQSSPKPMSIESVMPSNHLILCHPLLLLLRGASSAPGKGLEEGGLAYAKAGSSLRSLPGNSQASTPKTRVCLLSALCFHLHLWLYGGLSPTTSLWKKH